MKPNAQKIIQIWIANVLIFVFLAHFYLFVSSFWARNNVLHIESQSISKKFSDSWQVIQSIAWASDLYKSWERKILILVTKKCGRAPPPPLPQTLAWISRKLKRQNTIKGDHPKLEGQNFSWELPFNCKIAFLDAKNNLLL